MFDLGDMYQQLRWAKLPNAVDSKDKMSVFFFCLLALNVLDICWAEGERAAGAGAGEGEG